MPEIIGVTVTAKDDASDDFQRIGKAAQTMGQQVQTAGKAAGSGLTPVGPAAKNAQKALSDVETQAKKTAASSDDIKKKWTEVGAAAGVLVTGLSVVGRAYVEQERQIDGLERAYGDASVQLLEFAEEMQRTTVYSNDAARAATLSAASLAQNYGLTADQIEDVVRASADLATVTGIDLQDATTRVAGAIRGEGEAAELLGLNMSDSAVASLAAAAGLDGWTTSMTESEKAAFRFSVAMDQAAFATGAAADAAETNAGNARQFVNVLQDQVQALGGAIGPAAEYASVLGSFALAAPVAGAALGRLSAGIQAVRGSSAVAAAAFGPVGLGLVAVAGGAALAYQAWESYKDRQDNAVISTEELERATRSLLAVMVQIRDIGGPDSAITALNEASRELEELTATSGAIDTDNVAKLKDELFGINETMQEIRENGMSSDRPGVFFDASDLPALEQRRLALQATVTALDEAKVSEEELAAATQDLITITSDTTRSNYPQLIDAVNGLTAAHHNGIITNDSYLAAIARLADEVDTYGISLSDVVPAIGGVTHYFEAWTLAILENNAARTAGLGIGFIDPGDGGLGAVAPSADAAVASFEGVSTALGEMKERSNEAAAGQIKLAAGMAASSAAAAEHAAALREAQDAVVAYIASGENLLQLLYDSGKALSGEQGFIGGVIDLQNALTGLESAYSIIIDGSERLGATSENLASHFGDLVGVAIDAYGNFTYQWSLIDDLLAKGIIDQTQYTAAVDATTSILTSNMNIQQAIADIQIQQAPYLADLNAQTAEYVTNLADQSAEQQRAVLVMADANSQQQLAALYAAATDAAMGNLGTNGTQVVQAMADALQLTNPALYEMLQTSGQIDANGVFQFDGGDAASLVSTLADMNTNLENLVSVLAEINGITLDPKVSPDAEARLQRIIDKFNELRSINKDIGTYQSGNNVVGDATGGPTPGGIQSARGAEPVVIPVRLDVAAFTAGIAQVEQMATDLAGGEYLVNITADGKQAFAEITNAEGQVVALIQGDWIIPVNADGSQATDEAVMVEGAIEAVVGGRYVATINGDGSLALSEINTVNSALNYLNGTTGVIYVTGDGSQARYVIDSLTGFQGTAVINVIPQVVGNAFNALPFRDGGVVGYDAAALDGIVTKNGMRRILVGESGPELLNLPPGSGVTTAAMTSALRGKKENGGKELHFHFHAPVYGTDDLQQMIGQAVQSAAYAGHLS